MAKIDEACSCGAEFHWDDSTIYSTAAMKAAQEWRENHKHEFKPQPEVDVEALLREGLSAKGRLELWEEQAKEREPVNEPGAPRGSIAAAIKEQQRAGETPG
jgi:hypothetical protein